MAGEWAIALGNEIVDACGAILCDQSKIGLAEVGTFFAPLPDSHERTVASAVRHSVDALGVASWALSPLYRAAKARIGASRSDYCAATSMLVATPDFATAWAIRREHLPHTRERSGRIENELDFCALILRRSPKSVETWSHRAWVLKRYGWGDSNGIRVELDVACRAASAAPCNYYAGVHRARALCLANADIVGTEISRNREWLQTHVSDCSGWWYHALVVRRACFLSMWCSHDADCENSFASTIVDLYGKEYESVKKYSTWLENFMSKQKPKLRD